MNPDHSGDASDGVVRLPQPTGQARGKVSEGPGSAPPFEVQRREFFSMVSHEFRTPLAAMEGTHFLLRQRLAEHGDPSVRKYLAMQTEYLRVLHELVDRVLVAKESEGGTPETVCRCQRVAPLLRDIVDRVNAALPTARVVLSAQTDCAIVLDEHLFRAAVDNIIANALRYSAEDQRVDVACVRVGDRLEISVTDRGRGIAPADCARVFAPFFRGSNVGRLPGAGLGLTIARRAVKRLGGWVDFESVEGVGSCFVLHFPGALSPSEQLAV